MPLYIGCPYYQKDAERTIYCEGCSHFWWTKEKKEKFLRKTCEKNYTKCDYYKDLTKAYGDAERMSDIEAKEYLYRFYNQHLRKEIKKIKGILSKSEANTKRNIDLKQKEIRDYQYLVREARQRANEEIENKKDLLLVLMALMSDTDRHEIEFDELIEKAKEKNLKFKGTDKGISIEL